MRWTAAAVSVWCGLMASPAWADGKADARREALIELRFTENLNLTGRALDAEVVGDSAILNGTVKSEEDRALAERLVLDTGIRQVENRLTVELPPDPKPEKNPALTAEEREERRRLASARAREREATQPTATPAQPEPAAEAPAPAVTNPFQTAPVD